MDETEIDLWYEEKKQQLSEDYMKSIEHRMAVEERAKRFDRAMEKLNVKYEKRHKRYQRSIQHKEFRIGLLHALGYPFILFGKGITSAASIISNSTSRLFKDQYASAHFNANLIRIRHSHKFTDSISSFFRPVYYFYANHIKLPLIILASPFVRFGRFLTNKEASIVEGIKRLAAVTWKGIKIAAKYLFAHGVAAQKKIAAKSADWSKRYNAWQSKRVQAHLDKKKEREDAKKARAEAKGNAGEEAAQNTASPALGTI